MPIRLLTCVHTLTGKPGSCVLQGSKIRMSNALPCVKPGFRYKIQDLGLQFYTTVLPLSRIHSTQPAHPAHPFVSLLFIPLPSSGNAGGGQRRNLEDISMFEGDKLAELRSKVAQLNSSTFSNCFSAVTSLCGQGGTRLRWLIEQSMNR